MKTKSLRIAKIAIYIHLMTYSGLAFCEKLNYAYLEPNFTAITEIEFVNGFKITEETILLTDPGKPTSETDVSVIGSILDENLLENCAAITVHFIILDSAEFPEEFLEDIASQSSTQIPVRIIRESWPFDLAAFKKFINQAKKELQSQPVYPKLAELDEFRQADYLYKYIRTKFSDLCSLEISKVRRSQKALSSIFSKPNSETFEQQLTFPAFRNGKDGEERAVAFINDFFGKNISLTLYFEINKKTKSYTPDLKLAAYLKGNDGNGSIHFIPAAIDNPEYKEKAKVSVFFCDFVGPVFGLKREVVGELTGVKNWLFNIDYEFGKLFLSRLHSLYGRKSFWKNTWFLNGVLVTGLGLSMYVAMLLKG